MFLINDKYLDNLSLSHSQEFSVCLSFCLSIYGKRTLYNRGWRLAWNSDLPASASLVLGLEVYATKPGFSVSLFLNKSTFTLGEKILGDGHLDKEFDKMLGLVLYPCNPTTWGVETGGQN